MMGNAARSGSNTLRRTSARESTATVGKTTNGTLDT
jgi:hypothetical protein